MLISLVNSFNSKGYACLYKINFFFLIKRKQVYDLIHDTDTCISINLPKSSGIVMCHMFIYFDPPHLLVKFEWFNEKNMAFKRLYFWWTGDQPHAKMDALKEQALETAACFELRLILWKFHDCTKWQIWGSVRWWVCGLKKINRNLI